MSHPKRVTHPEIHRNFLVFKLFFNKIKFSSIPTPVKYKAPFFSDCYYHIVCKSIDGILLFSELNDFEVFAERLHQFANPFFDLWSYCLLNNHTHHIVKIKPIESIVKNIKLIPQQTVAIQTFLSDTNNEQFLDAMIERQMNSFLVSYANYTNNKYKRKGGLFQKPFKRLQIFDDSHLKQAIIYVHANAQKHNIINDFKNYPHSSYFKIINCDNQFVSSKEVVDFFGGMDKFIELHHLQIEHYYKGYWPSSQLE